MSDEAARKTSDQAREVEQEAAPLEKAPDATKVRNASGAEKTAAFDANKKVFRSMSDVLAIPDGATYEEAKARQVAYEQKPVESFGITLEDGRVETVKGIEPARKLEHGEKLAMTDDYLNRERQKPTPHDGQTLTLKQLFEDYKTPYMDAYEHSKALKDGQPGKSKTLEEIVDRLKDCPWGDKIWINFDSHAKNTEYDNEKSTITIRPQDLAEKQILSFVHEGYHATHQFLSKLYDGGPVDRREFENVWMKGEVGAMLAETAVFKELGLKEGYRPKFFYDDKGIERHIVINDYAKQFGEQGLLEFLRTAQPRELGSRPYGEHYASFFERYENSFQRNKAAVDHYLQQWVKASHLRNEI